MCTLSPCSPVGLIDFLGMRLERIGTWDELVNSIGKVSELDILPCCGKRRGKLFRSCMPNGSYDADGEVAGKWREIEPKKVVSLISDDEIVQKAGSLPGSEYCADRLQTDLWACSDATIVEAVRVVLEHLSRGETVIVHCSGGVGRVGVFACLLLFYVHCGREASIDAVRQYIPSALKGQKHVALFDRIALYITATFGHRFSVPDHALPSLHGTPPPADEWVTVLGFGSLLSRRSALCTTPSLRHYQYVRVLGYQRRFKHPAAVFFERGESS